jgi:para-aminobenzoate synthetase component 1
VSTPVADHALAVVGGMTARGLQRTSRSLADLDSGGRWAVSVGFEGDAVLAQFEHWSQDPPHRAEISAFQPPTGQWRDSLPQGSFEAAVRQVRELIAAGEVYQVNVCRLLSADVAADYDPAALWQRIAGEHPAPYGGFLRLPELSVVSASPELFLSRDGDRVRSGPIKGTAANRDGFSAKDRAENIMIVDLVRNDLGRVSQPGSVTVPGLMTVEEHPGLFHLVSYVSADLVPGTSWTQLFAALFPPGSVTGAPKLAALDVIADLEPEPRGPYCGAFGWVDADRGIAELAVAIRTFWIRDGVIRFGTGAGITWGSDPEAEWRETQLKAQRLMALANGAG